MSEQDINSLICNLQLPKLAQMFQNIQKALICEIRIYELGSQPHTYTYPNPFFFKLPHISLYLVHGTVNLPFVIFFNVLVRMLIEIFLKKSELPHTLGPVQNIYSKMAFRQRCRKHLIRCALDSPMSGLSNARFKNIFGHFGSILSACEAEEGQLSSRNFSRSTTYQKSKIDFFEFQ